MEEQRDQSSFSEAEKRRARERVKEALRRGKIAKPEECEECGARRPLQGHHPDYGRPLEVRWLCTECHTIEHHGTTFRLEVAKSLEKGVIDIHDHQRLLGLPRVCGVCHVELLKSPPGARYCAEHRPAR